MWYVICALGGFALGVIIIACFSVNSYNKGYKDGQREDFNLPLTREEAERRLEHISGIHKIAKRADNESHCH